MEYFKRQRSNSKTLSLRFFIICSFILLVNCAEAQNDSTKSVAIDKLISLFLSTGDYRIQKFDTTGISSLAPDSMRYSVIDYYNNKTNALEYRVASIRTPRAIQESKVFAQNGKVLKLSMYSEAGSGVLADFEVYFNDDECIFTKSKPNNTSGIYCQLWLEVAKDLLSEDPKAKSKKQ